jgi:hypothetical protein
MKPFLTSLLCCALLLALAAASHAADPAAANATAPGAMAVNATVRTDRATPVAVEHQGADRLGQRLALELKERLNASSLFILTPADTPRLKVVVRTTEEFPGRPGLGTAVSVTWVYSGGAGLLGHYLDGMVAVTDAAGVAALVPAIAGRTDEVAGSYAYLFAK